MVGNQDPPADPDPPFEGETLDPSMPLPEEVAAAKKGVIGGAVEGSKKVVVGSAKVVAGGAKAATAVTVATTRSFGFGFTCIMRGVWRLFVTPKWWPYALIPFVLAIFAFAGVMWWTGGWVTDVVDEWTTSTIASWTNQEVGEISGFVAWLISLLVWIGVALIALFYLFPPFARLVAAPFMAIFADKVVEDISGVPAPPPPGGKFLRFVLRPIWEAFVLLLVRIVVMVVAAPLLLIPVAGQILYALLIFPIEAMDLLDWAQSSRGVPLNRRLPFIRQHFYACMGLGAGSAAFLFIPVVNVFVMPSLVIGAVLLDQELSPDFPGKAALPGPKGDA